MRINLVTPFAEKDAAKALGARWDSAKKTWYINDVADLTPFKRWIRDANAQAHEASRAADTVPTRTGTTPGSGGTLTVATRTVAHCGCTVLPWEPCTHG